MTERIQESVQRAGQHSKVYRDCPVCDEGYLTLTAVDADTAEYPCGHTATRVPTEAERSDT